MSTRFRDRRIGDGRPRSRPSVITLEVLLSRFDERSTVAERLVA